MDKTETRYIKTKVDGQAKTLHMCSCNLCPLLLFNKNNRIASCDRFFSESLDNIVDINIYSYSIIGSNYLPLKEINIPKWCDLPDNILTISREENTYVRNGQDQYIKIPSVFGSASVISSLYVEYDKEMKNLVNKYTKNFNLKALQEKYNTPLPSNRCSCCGLLKDNVDRHKNYGMCSECWKNYSTNEKMKQFAYINNFRLKRNSTWTDEIIKKIEK